MHCALCDSSNVVPVLDLGEQALAGAFLKPEGFDAEKRYPLALVFCEDCYSVQIERPVSPAILFKNYFYFTSAIGTMRQHFTLLAREIVERFHPARVVEIGCNDGALLRPLADLGVITLGVDPATNVTNTIPYHSRVAILNERFGKHSVPEKWAEVVVACNVFAHMDNVPEACEAVRDLLTEGGAFIIEVNRLDSLVTDLQYDWVYHEHRFYYSLIALQALLKRHGLEVFEVTRIATHAGSMRVYAGHPGQHPIHSSVKRQIAAEQWACIDRPKRLEQFGRDAAEHRDRLREIVTGWRGDCAGYGACGRTNTLLQFAGLDHRHIPYIVDDAPAKHGFYTPGSHIPVVPRLQGAPAHLLVFAWSFLHEIQGRIPDYPGELVVPLPQIRAMERRVAA